jgi:hypothetical protein
LSPFLWERKVPAQRKGIRLRADSTIFFLGNCIPAVTLVRHYRALELAEFAKQIPFLLTRLFLRKIASSNFGSQKSGIFALRERKGASERFIRGY